MSARHPDLPDAAAELNEGAAGEATPMHSPKARPASRRLTADDIAQIQATPGEAFLSPAAFAKLVNIPRSTIYKWIGEGRFDGTFVKVGNHIRFLQHKAVQRFWSGLNKYH